MDKKELKKLMTKVAKGEISQKDAEILMKSKKGENQRAKQSKSSTPKRKSQLNKIKEK